MQLKLSGAVCQSWRHQFWDLVAVSCGCIHVWLMNFIGKCDIDKAIYYFVHLVGFESSSGNEIRGTCGSPLYHLNVKLELYLVGFETV